MKIGRIRRRGRVIWYETFIKIKERNGQEERRMEGLRYIEPQQVSHLVVTLELKWPQLSKQILLRILTTETR